MARFLRSCRSAFLSGPVLFLAMLAVLGSAQAANFSVSPTQISLGLNSSSELVITNQSKEVVTLSVTGYVWRQNGSGKPDLKTSDDILAFPGIFTLVPLQRQTIRIGVTLPPGASERTYRVIVSELPSPQIRARSNGASIRVLTAFSVPVFVSPLSSQTTVVFENPRVSGGKFSFGMANSGTVHIAPSSITVTAKDGSGRNLWSHAATAWYILAGDRATISIPIPSSVCSAAREYVVHVVSGEARFDHTFADLAGCRS